MIVYLYLIVKHNYRDDRLNKLNPWVMVGSWMIGGVIAATALITRSYNYNPATCWYAGLPLGCGGDPDADDYLPCVRGAYADVLTLILYSLFLPIIISWAVIYAVVYFSVRRTEYRLSRYAGSIRRDMDQDQDHSTTSHTNNMSSNVLENTSNRHIERTGSNAVARQAMTLSGTALASGCLGFGLAVAWVLTGTSDALYTLYSCIQPIVNLLIPFILFQTNVVRRTTKLHNPFRYCHITKLFWFSRKRRCPSHSQGVNTDSNTPPRESSVVIEFHRASAMVDSGASTAPDAVESGIDATEST